MAEVSAIVRRRGGHRAICTRAINEIMQILGGTQAISEIDHDNVEELTKLKSEMTLLEKQRGTIESLENRLYDIMEDENELSSDMLESAQRWTTIESVLHRCRQVIMHCDKRVTQRNESSSNGKNCNTNLPKLNLPRFGGNILEWLHFWQIYEKAIHNNESFSKSEKFSYLNGQLYGQAFELIAGFSVSDAFYDEAIQLLLETYGDERVLINAHIDGILDIRSPAPNSAELIKFRSEYENHIRGLIGLKTKVIEAGFIVVAILVRKLPAKIVDNINRCNNSPFWNLNDFRTAITNEIKLLQTFEIKVQTSGSSKVNEKVPKYNYVNESHKNGSSPSQLLFKPKSTCSFNINASVNRRQPSSNYSKRSSCLFCFDQHESSACIKYASAKAKSDRAGELNLCKLCLINNHKQFECKSRQVCNNCHNKHNSMLCFKLESSTKTYNDKHALVSSSCTYDNNGNGVALPIAILCVKTENNLVYLRSLFDQGAQRTFMLRHTAERLCLQPIRTCKLTIDGFNSKGVAKYYDIVRINIRTKYKLTVIEAVLCDTLPEMINIPGIKHASDTLKNMGIELADTYIYNDIIDNISLIIGSDYYFSFVKGISCYNGINTLESDVGCMIVGNLPRQVNHNYETMNILTSLIFNDCNVVTDKHLSDAVENLWKLDLIGFNLDSLTNDENLANDIFKNNIKLINGRYEVKLPWRINAPYLPRGYNLAKARLFNTFNKLTKDNNVSVYDRLINEQLKLGFIEKVDPHEYHAGGVHYLPHHGVKKDSLTTPLRIVFDCSAGKPSLNDCLYSGPSLVSDLIQVLLRFRINKFVMIADIAKAYHMINLCPSDRNYTRFLWPSDIGDMHSDLNEYRFKVVLFGATCSQFILLATINHHLISVPETLRNGILRNLYIDNLQVTGNDINELIHLYNKTNLIFSQAGLIFREWISNSQCINNVFMQNNDKTMNQTPTIKILGIYWHYLNDEFQFDYNLPLSLSFTKRNVASLIARIFDPLGFISPILIRGKIFMQDLWKLKLGWDDVIDPDLFKTWNDIILDLNAAKEFSISRAFTHDKVIDLHAFSDASLKAYGLVIYAVSAGKSCFVMSKSRVCPIKTLTIPQLELTACNMAARLLSYVKKALDYELTIKDQHIWCDSQVTISWILSKNKHLKPYVQNRVDEIRRYLPDLKLHYVSTKENPADFISRGIKSRILLSSALWINGPAWLSKGEYPNMNYDKYNEYNENIITNLIQTDIHNKWVLSDFIDVSRFSSFLKLKKVMILVHRFIKIIRSKIQGHDYAHLSSAQNHNFSSTEIAEGIKTLIMLVQKEHFRVELCAVADKDGMIKGTNFAKQLGVFQLDGLLRCKGRFELSNHSFDAKYPILLPPNHCFTDLLIKDIHKSVGHFGANYVISEIRRNWWIPRIRQNVKRVINRCIVCKKLQGKPFNFPQIAPMPKTRITRARPFSIIGIDYTGALQVKLNGSTSKVYISLFTCAVTRAIHLELVNDLTMESFLLAFRRFSARRGIPNHIYSDNATYFIAAAKYLTNTQFNGNIIKWSTIPARASWYGGFWERLIGITKGVLKKILGRSYVNFTQLNTIIIEIEMILNNRPLTYVSDSMDELSAITPSELLVGHKFEPSFQDYDSDEDFKITREIVTSRYKRLTLILNHFWKRWHLEYLGALRERHTWFQNKCNNNNQPKVGDVVQIFDEFEPRISWRLGIVMNLHIGCDGKIRSVSLKTNNGIISRSVIHLYPLELHTELFSENSDQIVTSPLTKNRTKRVSALRARKLIKSQLN